MCKKTLHHTTLVQSRSKATCSYAINIVSQGQTQKYPPSGGDILLLGLPH